MTSIVADAIRIEYPILDSTNRSLKRRFVSSATGGRIAHDARDHLVVTALDDVTFTVRAGERVALIGHNGSGKTTLLRSIAGVYEPIRGTLRVDGSISSLFDIGIGFDPEATGRENVYLRGFVMGMKRADLAARIEAIRDFSGLGDYLELPLRTYSSGMLFRLAFSIVTAMPSDIVLMDEWMSTGDADFADRAAARLQEFVDRTSILVLATHSDELARRVCTRRIELSHGRVVKDERIGSVH